MSGYVLTKAALLELDEIWTYIAQDNPEAADRWIEKLLGTCEILACNPHMGHARVEITDKPVLFWPVDTYLSFTRCIRTTSTCWASHKVLVTSLPIFVGAPDRHIHLNFSVMETIGCGTAIVTPFRADGSVDEPALYALVNWQIESGIDFLVACGSTGEAATLDEEEWLHVVRIVIEAAAGRVPVWAGCTHNSTRTLLRQAALLKRVHGLSAVLSANPYYNKPTQEGQFQHFLALARAVDPLPVCLYNVPGRTAANLEPETVARLAAAAKNIQAIKEASGKLHAVCRAGAYRCPAASRSSPATTTWRWPPSAWARMGSSAWPPTRRPLK